MLSANREQIRLQIIDLREQGVGIREISRQINVTRNSSLQLT
jgi:transposase-like protein